MYYSKRYSGWLALFVILCGLPSVMRSELPGSVSGTVIDASGAPVGGALIELSRGETAPKQDSIVHVVSQDDGTFSFTGVAAGPFRLSITASGFAPQTVSGLVGSGQQLQLSPTVLAVGRLTTDVEVTVTRKELAEDQIKVEEKQRLLGFVPNYYVTYLHDATLPLTPRQKFELAWKTMIDPVSFGINAVIAGVEQSRDDFAEYGQGAEGYSKRFAASYADFVSGTMISGAILPSLLKQDPRYFYKGTGSKRSRILYALATSVICKGDNGRWQPNYSSVLGGLTGGGISNLYHPAPDRGWGLTFENAFIGIVENAAGNVIQEFFFRKLTSKAPHDDPAKP
jgi:hypothetical protein